MSITVTRAVAQERSRVGKKGYSSSYLLSAVGVGLVFGAYNTLRYLGLWSENDTAVFIQIIAGMQRSGRLAYEGAYPHGYAYQTWLTTLSHLTGVRSTDLIQLYTPLVGNLMLAAFGFAAFRRLLASDSLGLLAAACLFLVPELVFTVSRGNHEKLTVALTLLALLALLNSFLERAGRARWSVFTGWVLTFYLTGFTLLTLNIFFGSGFLVASTLTLIFAAILLYLKPQQARQLVMIVNRLVYTVGAAWLLSFLVRWFIYPQSEGNSQLFQTAYERLTTLFAQNILGFEPDTPTIAISNPYSVGNTDWSSLIVYRLVSSFRWLLFVGSFLTWLRLLIKAWYGLRLTPIHVLFMLSLYGAFGFQLAMGIPVDFLNLEAGSNLQVRLYIYFSLFAVPVFAYGLFNMIKALQRHVSKRLLTCILGAALCTFAVISLLKATLDPIVSNRWQFYDQAEVTAVSFWDQRVGDSIIWLGPEERLYFAYLAEHITFRAGHGYEVGEAVSSTNALASPIIAANAVAWGAPLPDILLGQQVYDNGNAQIYHRIPTTPFQR